MKEFVRYQDVYTAAYVDVITNIYFFNSCLQPEIHIFCTNYNIPFDVNILKLLKVDLLGLLDLLWPFHFIIVLIRSLPTVKN